MTNTRFTFEDLVAATSAKVLTPLREFPSTVRVWTDTRSLQPGDFFLPLSGERFDGHDYIPQALEQGAVGAFASLEKFAAHPEWSGRPNLLGVPAPLLAYLSIARFHRRRINPLVVAVTGSSGKTTTKEMLYSALSPLMKTQKTEKNFNNEVGLSQTMLALEPGTELLIAEMGMRGLNQISLLSEYAEPDIAMVVNVGPAHIGLLGSLENIAIAKCEIFSGLKPDKGTGVVNGDDALLLETARKTWFGKLLTFSLDEVQDIDTASEGGVSFTYQGHRVRLPLPGRHNVSNALAVLKVGEALGFPAEDLIPGLENFAPGEGRWHRAPLEGVTNAWVVNDAYNANPASVQAALRAFLETPAPGLRRVLVLGGMKELGDLSQRYHEELGDWLAGQSGVDEIIVLGEEGRWVCDAARHASFPVHHAAEREDAVRLLKQSERGLENTLLFLKGSRAYRLEEIPGALARSVHGL